MIKFLCNLFKVITKKKEKHIEHTKMFALGSKQDAINRISEEKNVRWIRDGLGVERTGKGIIIHAINCDETPEEIMEIITDLMRKGEL